MRGIRDSNRAVLVSCFSIHGQKIGQKTGTLLTMSTSPTTSATTCTTGIIRAKPLRLAWYFDYELKHKPGF
jgi:hypothetical protein